MTIICALIAVLLAATAAVAQPLPVPKTGSCPAGYASGASYCSPMQGTRRDAIPKVGQCPSGFMQSGNYCLRQR
jgi:hypothetical protein